MAATLGGLAFFVLAQVLTGRWKLTRAALGGLAALATGGLLVALAGDVLITRAFHTSESAVARAYIWKAHWEAFLASPVFGYGLGNFETVNKTLIAASNFNELWNIRSALDVYLQWLEQAGLAGAAPMFLCIAALLVSTFAGALRRSRMTVILFALLAADVTILAHGITDFALETPSFSAFWTYLLGLQFALAQGSSAR
jgi:O-antigen ligase